MTRARIFGPGPGQVRPTASVTRLTSSLLALSLLGISLLPTLSSISASADTATRGATAVTSGPPAAPAPPLTVSLTAITPAVSVPGAPVTIHGRVRNAGAVPVTSLVARALIGQSSMTSREAVSVWASTAAELPLEEVAHTSLGPALAPGAVASFTLTIPANAISRRESFAVLPLRLEVAGTTSAGVHESRAVHTFMPALGPIKAFEPISIAWLVPLTLDPDPALYGTPGTTRTKAWTRAVGPGSRLDRVIQGTQASNATWAIDPAILGPLQTPSSVDASATPGPAPSASQPPSPDTVPAPDPVTGMTTALARQLKAAAPLHTLWSLPYSDPDLTALLPLTSRNQSLTALIHHPSTLDVAVGPARADIAWPVGKALTLQDQAQLRRAFASPGLTAAVTPGSILNSHNGSTANASRRSSSGLPLLDYDERLSRTFAQTSSTSSGALTIQRFLAESLALLGERPGTPDRSVLVAAPRTFAGDPGVLRSLFAAVAHSPWLRTMTTGQLLAAAEELAPESPGSGATGPSGRPTSPPASTTVTDPLGPGSSPLTADRLAAIPGTLSVIAGIDSILSDGHRFASTWSDAQVQQLSARWRNHPEGLTALDAATASAIKTLERGVKVNPTRVNFLADRGVMQVTVVNDLAVPVHDVHLTLTPAQPRLRIERQPPPLKIGAKSRANVLLQVTSIAAGLVKIDAVLTAPNGTQLGQDASVNVHVQPPSSWIYWALGGLAGIILVLGTQRSLRRGSTRASRPDPQEPALHD